MSLSYGLNLALFLRACSGSHKANMDPRTHQDLSDAAKTSLAEPVFASPGDVVLSLPAPLLPPLPPLCSALTFAALAPA